MVFLILYSDIKTLMTKIHDNTPLANVSSSTDIENMSPVQPVSDLIDLLEETKSERRELWFNLVDVYEKLATNCEDDDGFAIDELEDAVATLSSETLARPLLEVQSTEMKLTNSQNTKGIDHNVKGSEKSKIRKKCLKENKTPKKRVFKSSVSKVNSLFNETRNINKRVMTKTIKFSFDCANKPIKVCHCGMINVL